MTLIIYMKIEEGIESFLAPNRRGDTPHPDLHHAQTLLTITSHNKLPHLLWKEP